MTAMRQGTILSSKYHSKMCDVQLMTRCINIHRLSQMPSNLDNRWVCSLFRIMLNGSAGSHKIQSQPKAIINSITTKHAHFLDKCLVSRSFHSSSIHLRDYVPRQSKLSYMRLEELRHRQRLGSMLEIVRKISSTDQVSIDYALDRLISNVQSVSGFQRSRGWFRKYLLKKLSQELQIVKTPENHYVCNKQRVDVMDFKVWFFKGKDL